MKRSLEQARCNEAVAFLRQRWKGEARAGIVIGTGLGELASQIETKFIIPYDEIPHFPESTAMGHAGRLVIGRLGAVDVVALDGRFHFYEGYRAEQITFPIAVLKRLGIELLVLSNASGGLNPQYRSGDLMVLADHINWMGTRTASLVRSETAPSRSSLASPYDRRLIEIAEQAGRRGGFACHRGTYIAVLGPNYETRAEYRAMRRVGGDAVGMSTVPEVLAAMRCGLRVFAISTITNIARPDIRTSTTPEEVIDIAANAEPKVRHIVMAVIHRSCTEPVPLPGEE